jgi:hypothetical protein
MYLRQYDVAALHPRSEKKVEKALFAVTIALQRGSGADARPHLFFKRSLTNQDITGLWNGLIRMLIYTRKISMAT